MSDFCVDHSSCSRVHAALVYHKHLNRAFLVDLGSSESLIFESLWFMQFLFVPFYVLHVVGVSNSHNKKWKKIYIDTWILYHSLQTWIFLYSLSIWVFLFCLVLELIEFSYHECVAEFIVTITSFGFQLTARSSVASVSSLKSRPNFQWTASSTSAPPRGPTSSGSGLKLVSIRQQKNTEFSFTCLIHKAQLPWSWSDIIPSKRNIVI
jgi:hypothetical protein